MESLLQLADSLELLPNKLVHPPPLLVLSGFSHSLLLLTPNTPNLSLLLSLHISPEISHSLLNGLHMPRPPMNVITHLVVPLSKSCYLYLEVRKRLKEARIKRHEGCEGRAPYLKIWVLCLWF